MPDLEIKTMTGAEFERVVSRRLDKYRNAGKADIRKSGVHAVMTGPGQWQVIDSKPDFEGLLPGPRPIYFDCKACSQASFDLNKYREETGNKWHQLKYLLDRASYGATSFFLMHWNARELATKSEEAVTYVFPVSAEMEFWVGFRAGETRRITRGDCEELGRVVPWNRFGELDRSVQPDILAVL